MIFKIFELFQIVLLIQSCSSTSSFIETEAESDYIECYWCNSRDTYCGKRVTDTMVTTIKCPKHSKCTDLHRGCTYGMDLGKVVIENGCFIEEDGSTYCFCDFNRCNAAGILDLRNLIDEKKTNSIFRLENNTNNVGLNDLILNHFDKLQDETKTREKSDTFNAHTTYTTQSARILITPTRVAATTTTSNTNTKKNVFSKKKSTAFTTTNLPKTTSFSTLQQANTSMFPFKTSYDPKKGNLNELLNDYLKFSKSFKDNHNSSISFDKYQALNKLNNMNQTSLLKKPKANPKNSMFIDYPGTSNPLQYKLKINDTLSKKLIENFRLRSNLGLKPNEKINIVLLKRPIKQEFSPYEAMPNNKIQSFEQMILNSNKMSKSLIKRPPELEQTRHMNKQLTSTTNSWLSKLKAKLLPNLSEQRFDVYGVTEPNYSWNPAVTQKLKQGNNISFNCPRDGLFSHPTSCFKFLQCLYFGSIHQRYEVFDCPAGLYFNQSLELCDYPQNVQCN